MIRRICRIYLADTEDEEEKKKTWKKDACMQMLRDFEDVTITVRARALILDCKKHTDPRGIVSAFYPYLPRYL